jgi:Protein of unknown function (DUF1552)
VRENGFDWPVGTGPTYLLCPVPPADRVVYWPVGTGPTYLCPDRRAGSTGRSRLRLCRIYGVATDLQKRQRLLQREYGTRVTKLRPPHRRTFLKGASVSLALPMLESTRVAQGATHDKDSAYRSKRLVCVGVYLGFHQRDFFPSKTGRNYDISPVLEPIESFRDEMTIFSGLDHRGRNGHEGWRA